MCLGKIMGKRNDEAVMVLTMVALVVGVAIVNVNATNVEMDLSNLLQIENKLKLLNKPSIKTIYVNIIFYHLFYCFIFNILK